MKYTHEDLNMLGDIILIEPAQELNELVQKLMVPDELKNTGKKAKQNAIKELKEEERKYSTVYQVGKILSIGAGVPGNNFKVGDKVIYNMQKTIILDLLAKEDNDKTCPHMIKSWDIVSTIKEVE